MSSFSLISRDTAFISVSPSNSKMTIDIFSLEIELTSLIFEIVAIDCSTGFVTVVSTVSGDAPWYVVITIAYGSSILGSKSVVIFVNDTIPKMITSTTATMTVYGFFTLNFEIIFLPFSHFFSYSLFVSFDSQSNLMIFLFLKEVNPFYW